jgi:hypothetical protein
MAMFIKSNKHLIDINNCLHPSLAIKSAGSHPYKIGLSLFKFHSEKRHWINPLFIFIITSIVSIRATYSLTLPEDSDIFIKIGDFAHFSNMTIHGNVMILQYYLLSIIFQSIHYWHYLNNIKPSYMRPFEMLAV